MSDFSTVMNYKFSLEYRDLLKSLFKIDKNHNILYRIESSKKPGYTEIASYFKCSESTLRYNEKHDTKIFLYLQRKYPCDIRYIFLCEN